MIIQKDKIGKAEINVCHMSKYFVEQEDNKCKLENIGMNNILGDIFYVAENMTEWNILKLSRKLAKKWTLWNKVIKEEIEKIRKEIKGNGT